MPVKTECNFLYPGASFSHLEWIWCMFVIRMKSGTSKSLADVIRVVCNERNSSRYLLPLVSDSFILIWTELALIKWTSFTLKTEMIGS